MKCRLNDGRSKKLAQAVKGQLSCEGEEFTAARQRVEEELQRIGPIIDNLLDNITPTNREFVDKRLAELTRQRQQLEALRQCIQRIHVNRLQPAIKLQLSLVPASNMKATGEIIKEVHVVS